MENGKCNYARLANLTTCALQTLNDTASQFATHSSTIAVTGLALAASIRFTLIRRVTYPTEYTGVLTSY